MPIWDVARRYREAGDPVVLVAGERYGTGSSRDWAAKGQRLLGIRAVLASSFERIHRSNLIGMGILPLRLPAGVGPRSAGAAAAATASRSMPPTGGDRAALRGAGAHPARRTARVERFDRRSRPSRRSSRSSCCGDGGVIPPILHRTLAGARGH